MKQCLALAGLACLLASGCATSSGFFGGGQPAHVTTSRSASRPTILRGYNKGGPELGVKLASFNNNCTDAGCGCAETDCGCAVDGGNGCGGGLFGASGGLFGGGGCGADGCNGGPCRRVIDGIASGGCGPGCGLGPHGGGYPEYPSFNQGPPVGQVAYPYYTTRGPRDFLHPHPPTIGPY
jgi:hypothetical protein